MCTGFVLGRTQKWKEDLVVSAAGVSEASGVAFLMQCRSTWVITGPGHLLAHGILILLSLEECGEILGLWTTIFICLLRPSGGKLGSPRVTALIPPKSPTPPPCSGAAWGKEPEQDSASSALPRWVLPCPRNAGGRSLPLDSAMPQNVLVRGLAVTLMQPRDGVRVQGHLD